MQENIKDKKTSSKRYEPKGLTIVHEDKDIIVIDKSSGLLSISTAREKEKTAFFLLNNYVKKGNAKSKSRVFIVHRLDRETSGLLVFAKNEKVKLFLQENWQKFSKTYFAVVHGKFPQRDGIIESYLTENKAYMVYSTPDIELGKYSKTGYKVMKESKKYSMLMINLFTGRKNQIRVHFAENGNPVVGDRMYGEEDKTGNRLALHSASLTIIHPHTNKEVTFRAEIPTYFRSLLKQV